MIEALPPLDEVRRLAAVHSLHMLDTLPEERFDRITRMAVCVFDIPIALISLIDEHRQWFKSFQGISFRQISRPRALCAHTILGSDVLLVPDTHLDPRFADNPLVVDNPFVRFYAGYPLRGVDGSKIGTLAILDSRTRTLNDTQIQMLRDLGAWVERELSLLELPDQTGEIQLRTLISNAPILLYTIDHSGIVTFSAGKGLERLELRLGAMTNGQSVFDRFRAFPEVLGDIQRALAGELFSTMRDVGNMTLQTWYTPLHAPNEVLIGTMGVSFDVTEHRQVERALEEDRAAAEAVARIKAEFLSNISHEIRTPLNAVIGLAGLLLDTALTPEQRHFAQTIYTNSDTLLAMVNDILDLSKIEAGKLELEHQPFDLRACIEESLDLFAPKAAEKGLDLAYRVDAHVPYTIIGDISHLRQVLVNLLSNAVKFTEKGDVMLEVSGVRVRETDRNKHRLSAPVGEVLTRSVEGVERHSELFPLPTRPPRAGNWGEGEAGSHCEVAAFEPALSPIARPPISDRWQLQFAVRDTGIGIPTARIGHLFRPFVQVDASTTRKYAGTGLGLVISKHLVEAMGGTIWAESEPGKGSTFTFTILAESRTDQRPPYLQEMLPELMGKRVLIVDDNATNRSILSHQIQRWGMHPIEAESGVEALKWLQRGEPCDVALLDRHMPEMDGQQLAVAIQTECKRFMPLIMLSSVGDSGEMQKPRQYVGVFLTKPVKPYALYEALINLVADQQHDRDRGALPSPLKHPDKPPTPPFPLRILLAEDNAIGQKVALQVLAKLGYRADVAANGQEVLLALEQTGPYDVVLMDIQMPEMDGIEASRQIGLRWPASERPRIVAVTANVRASDRERYMSAGMDDCLSKPIRLSELATVLERCQSPDRRFSSSASPRREREHTEHGRTDAAVSALQDAASPLDLETFHNFRMMVGDEDPTILQEMIDLYLNNVPVLLNNMRESLAQENARAFRVAAHALKSSSANFGATTLVALCARQEALGRAGTLDEVTELLADTEIEFTRVQAVLLGLRNIVSSDAGDEQA